MCNSNDIELSEKDIQLSKEDIINFINFCQDKKYTIDESNVYKLHELGKRFELEDLLNYTEYYISKNYSVSFQSALLILIQNDDQSDSEVHYEKEEKIVSANFFKLIGDNQLLSLSVPVINRILNHYNLNINEIHQSQPVNFTAFSD